MGVVLDVVTVSVEEPEPPVMEGGLKVPVAPEGRPVTESDTVPLNPFTGDTVIV